MSKLSPIIAMVNYATTQHMGQVRKVSGLPYVTHLAEVAGYVSSVDQRDYTIMAAWGHDLIEDCQVTQSTLKAMFGAQVAAGIATLSDVWDAGSNRQERHQSSLKRLQGASDWVQDVKCADIISNLSTIHLLPQVAWRDMYIREKFEQLDILHMATPSLRSYAYSVATRAEEKCRAA